MQFQVFTLMQSIANSPLLEGAAIGSAGGITIDCYDCESGGLHTFCYCILNVCRYYVKLHKF